MRYISDETIKTIKDRLDPVSEPDELYDIINDLLMLRNAAVISTVEDWLYNNYPTKEETLDTINCLKFWKAWCYNCQHRNRSIKIVMYDVNDVCSLANQGQPPIVKNGSCQTHKTDFSSYRKVEDAKLPEISSPHFHHWEDGTFYSHSHKGGDIPHGHHGSRYGQRKCICTDDDPYTCLYNQYQSEFPDHEIDVDDVLFADDEYCACKCHAKTKDDEENFTSGEYLKKPDLNKSVIKMLKEKWESET